MSVQKIIEYNLLAPNGQILSDKYTFKLNILEDSGNYLIHRDILRHQLSQKQGTVSTKTRSEVRGGGKKPWQQKGTCLLYTSPSPRDKRQSRMPSSA